MNRNRIGARLFFQSKKMCPVCGGLFMDSEDKVALTDGREDIGFLHEDCHETFQDLLSRLSEISKGVSDGQG